MTHRTVHGPSDRPDRCPDHRADHSPAHRTVGRSVPRPVPAPAVGGVPCAGVAHAGPAPDAAPAARAAVRRVRGLLLAAAVLTAWSGAAVPAHAAPADGHGTDVHASRADTWLRLTVTRGDARSRDTRGTLLLCDPPQGHARAAEACARLAAVDGDLNALPPSHGICTMIYAPVTAHAEGLWKGRPVHYRKTFANPCAMEARTGAVFALDD